MRARSIGKRTRGKARKKAAGKVGKKTSAGDQLAFRPRTPDDDDYILQLTEEQLAAVHQQAFGEVFPRERFRRYLQSGAPTVVVEQGKKRIGYYSYLLQPEGKMHISALVIEPAYQSTGVGSQVMRHLEDEARKHGIHTLEVFVQAGNERSLAFTRKLGFIEVYYVTPTTICFHKHIADGAQGRVPGQPNVATNPFPLQFP
jgi:GNAT superfamily N-acetyltransferase